jgi:hypothetical protein
MCSYLLLMRGIILKHNNKHIAKSTILHQRGNRRRFQVEFPLKRIDHVGSGASTRLFEGKYFVAYQMDHVIGILGNKRNLKHQKQKPRDPVEGRPQNYLLFT